MVTEHEEALCHSDRAILNGFRLLKGATYKSGVMEELNTIEAGLKEETISLKREIKEIKVCKNRELDGLGEYF